MKLHVNTADLSKALKAVLPHASDDPELPSLACVQVHVTWENLFLTATNRYTAGMASVSVWEREGLTGSQSDDFFTLSRDVVKEMLRFFRAKPKPENELDDQLCLEMTEKEFTVTDVSGLFPGKSVTWPDPQKVDNAPNLLRMFTSRLDRGLQVPARIITQGKFLKLFAAAAQAYGHPITVEPSTSDRSLMLGCGESFLGMLMQVSLEGDSDLSTELNEWRDWWRRVLPGVAAALDGREDLEEAA
ncbi:hypothetical protein M3B43_12045, partial [Nesterenkonia massiliensis]